MVSVKSLFAINKSLFSHMSINKNIKGVRNKQVVFFISFMNIHVNLFVTCTLIKQRGNFDSFFQVPCIS